MRSRSSRPRWISTRGPDEPDGRMSADASPVPDPVGYVPFLPGIHRVAPAVLPLGRRPERLRFDRQLRDEVPLIGDHLSLFALLMAVSCSSIRRSRQRRSREPTIVRHGLDALMSVWMMPIMMFFICNSLSSGLSYYYLLSNLITMLETWVIRKWFVNAEVVVPN